MLLTSKIWINSGSLVVRSCLNLLRLEGLEGPKNPTLKYLIHKQTHTHTGCHYSNSPAMVLGPQNMELSFRGCHPSTCD